MTHSKLKAFLNTLKKKCRCADNFAVFATLVDAMFCGIARMSACYCSLPFLVHPTQIQTTSKQLVLFCSLIKTICYGPALALIRQCDHLELWVMTTNMQPAVFRMSQHTAASRQEGRGCCTLACSAGQCSE